MRIKIINHRKTGGMPGCSTSLIVLLLVFAFAPLLLSLFGGAVGDQAQFSYSSFRNEVEAGNVAQVTVSGERITGELITPTTETIEDGTTREYSNFVTYFPAFGDDTLFGLLQANNVEVVTEPTQTFTWWSVLLNALPFLLLIAIRFVLLTKNAKSRRKCILNG
jgi:cell division protease FtsH